MKKRLVFIGLLIIIVIYLLIKFNSIRDIDENCFNNDFNRVFKKENLKQGRVYDFSEIFNCKEWDQLIIVGGQRASRTIIFLKEGVVLPPINYFNRAQGSLVFYLIKKGELLSSPISFYHSDFLYFEDFNSFDYVSLKKEDAIFKCVELQTIGSSEKILTFELTER